MNLVHRAVPGSFHSLWSKHGLFPHLLMVNSVFVLLTPSVCLLPSSGWQFPRERGLSAAVCPPRPRVSSPLRSAGRSGASWDGPTGQASSNGPRGRCSRPLLDPRPGACAAPQQLGLPACPRELRLLPSFPETPEGRATGSPEQSAGQAAPQHNKVRRCFWKRLPRDLGVVSGDQGPQRPFVSAGAPDARVLEIEAEGSKKKLTCHKDDEKCAVCS